MPVPIKRYNADEFRELAKNQPITSINLATAFLIQAKPGNIGVEYAYKLTDVLKALGVNIE